MNDEGATATVFSDSVFIRVVKDVYRKIFLDVWPIMVGGVLIGVVSVVCFTWSRPWGVVGGLRVWADWLLYGLGVYATQPVSAFTSSNSVIALGLFFGAVAAALITRAFAWRVPPRMELAKGAVGGILLGVGAALSGGCNVGAFYSSISALSLSGFVMLIGLLAGSWAGLKYLYWEMEHLPAGGAPPKPPKEGGFDFKRIQPILGFGLLAALVAASKLYENWGDPVLGGVLLCGVAFGIILHRSRFCFTRAFREPFMTGDSEVTRVVILSLMISVLGFATLKWAGFRAEMAYVTPHFGPGALVGGFIFGFGMLMAGG